MVTGGLSCIVLLTALTSIAMSSEDVVDAKFRFIDQAITYPECARLGREFTGTFSSADLIAADGLLAVEVLAGECGGSGESSHVLLIETASVAITIIGA